MAAERRLRAAEAAAERPQHGGGGAERARGKGGGGGRACAVGAAGVGAAARGRLAVRRRAPCCAAAWQPSGRGGRCGPSAPPQVSGGELRREGAAPGRWGWEGRAAQGGVGEIKGCGRGSGARWALRALSEKK